jgi:hypothetical protein
MNNAIAQFFPKCSEALQQHINSKMPRSRTGSVLPKQLPTFAALRNQEDCKRFVEVSYF